MNLQLRRLILNATKLLPNFNHSDCSYGASGVIEPGDIASVASIGPHVPEQGFVWLRDDRETFWGSRQRGTPEGTGKRRSDCDL
jgi:hypothetical protein